MNLQQGLIAYFRYQIDAAGLKRLLDAPVGAQQHAPAESDFVVTRVMLLTICDAVASGDLAIEDLEEIGATLTLSGGLSLDAEHYDLLSGICYGWSSAGRQEATTKKSVAQCAKRLKSTPAPRQPLGRVAQAPATESTEEQSAASALVLARCVMYGGWFICVANISISPLIVHEYLPHWVFQSLNRILAVALFYAWVMADSKVESYKLSASLRWGILIWPIGVPYYIFRSKGFWRGLESHVKFLGFLALAGGFMYFLHEGFGWRLPRAL